MLGALGFRILLLLVGSLTYLEVPVSLCEDLFLQLPTLVGLSIASSELPAHKEYDDVFYSWACRLIAGTKFARGKTPKNRTLSWKWCFGANISRRDLPRKASRRP
eukprot:gene25976-biopygen12499